MVEPPSVIGPLMDKHPTLYADTSFRERDILDSLEALDPAWEALLLKHQDRFMVGSDTWVNAQWDGYASLIDINRRWLALLPKEPAEAIAYKNAERLFNVDVSEQLFKTR